MRNKEQRLWDAMKRNLPAGLWMQRIENVVGEGMPDVYVGASGKWVELKAPSAVPARASTRLLGSEGLRPSQINWHLKNAACEKSPESFILIRTPDQELLLISGSLAETVNEMPLSLLRDISRARTWAEIERALS